MLVWIYYLLSYSLVYIMNDILLNGVYRCVLRVVWVDFMGNMCYNSFMIILLEFKFFLEMEYLENNGFEF